MGMAGVCSLPALPPRPIHDKYTKLSAIFKITSTCHAFLELLDCMTINPLACSTDILHRPLD